MYRLEGLQGVDLYDGVRWAVAADGVFLSAALWLGAPFGFFEAWNLRGSNII